MDRTMNPASSAPDPSRPDPKRSEVKPSPLPGTPVQAGPSVQAGSSVQRPGTPRRWQGIGLALLVLAVGYGGYRLGHSSAPAGTEQAGSGQFGAGQGGNGQFGAGQAGVGQTGAGQAGAGRFRRNREAGAGQGAAGQTGAAGAGAGGTAQGGAGQGGTATIGTGSSGAIIAVQAAQAKDGVLVTTRTATGTVATTQQTVVSARASGTVSGLPVSVGSTVQSGDTVVSLSSSDLNTAVQSAQNALDTARVSLSTQTNQTSGSRGQLQAAVAASQITLQNARTTLNAQERLYGIGAISQTDLNTARAAVQQAQSGLSSAQNSLDQNSRAGSETLASLKLAVQKAQISLTQAQQAAAEARVTAPFAGQVTAISVTGGQFLNAGTAAFTLTSSSRQVNFSVPPSQSGSIKVGQLLTYAVGQQKYSLKVTENAGAPVNGNVQVVARFVDAAKVPLLGAVGSVSYPYTVASGVVVPSTALQLDGENTSVFTVQSGKAKQVPVTVLGQANSQAAVSGIDSGEQVIAQPPSGLLDGASVTTDASGARAGSSSTAQSDANTTGSTQGQGAQGQGGQGQGTQGQGGQGQTRAGQGTQTPRSGATGTPPAGGPGGAP
ncbi:efflux RND transporter periplasmic adaptor subunit [Deinococcus altitudinis]|uniref:efflux RND transporter periplasmic adaptor subunit n=1 Tax=Deinococcus altitudinis TaxID=468914 RepID=UPI0038918D7E